MRRFPQGAGAVAVVTDFSFDGDLARRDAWSRLSVDGDRTIVRLAGEYDIATAYLLAETLAKAIALNEADLVVDLREVTFISSAAINVIVRGRTFMLDRGRTLSLRAPSRSARRVLEGCGLSALIDRERT